MEQIDEFIEKATTVQNTSDGGSPAYHFNNVVLIKYQNLIKYGKPRESAELIASIANKKNSSGVRTPAHLGIKRVVGDKTETCWVLQERAKGQNFATYCSNEDSKVQLNMQSILVQAPDSHYEHLVSDTCELFNLGLELKPKNVFYDDNIQNGGFTIIDLLEISGEPFNPNSLKDILNLNKTLQGLWEYSSISLYDNKATENEKNMSAQYSNQLKQKIFTAMEKTIPNFNQHRRSVLRSMSIDTLDFFAHNGTGVGDLTLTEQEQEQFNQSIKNIVDNSIQKIETGSNEYWEIGTNEIRNDLEQGGLNSDWLYHKANKREISEFREVLYPEDDYRSACTQDLKINVNQIFNERLSVISKNSSNSHILEAKNELDNKPNTQQIKTK